MRRTDMAAAKDPAKTIETISTDAQKAVTDPV
jgi:hypothetical protein